jgi:hypothetical protein
LRTTGFDSEADDEDEEVSAQQQCTSEPRGAVQRHLSEPPAPPSQLDRNVPSNCHQDVAWIVVNGYPIPAPDWFQDVLAQNQRLFDSLLVACRFARPRIDASQSLPNNNERYHLDVARRTCSNKNVAFDFRVYNFDAVCMPYNVDVPDFFKMRRPEDVNGWIDDIFGNGVRSSTGLPVNDSSDSRLFTKLDLASVSSQDTFLVVFKDQVYDFERVGDVIRGYAQPRRHSWHDFLEELEEDGVLGDHRIGELVTEEEKKQVQEALKASTQEDTLGPGMRGDMGPCSLFCSGDASKVDSLMEACLKLKAKVKDEMCGDLESVGSIMEACLKAKPAGGELGDQVSAVGQQQREIVVNYSTIVPHCHEANAHNNCYHHRRGESPVNAGGVGIKECILDEPDTRRLQEMELFQRRTEAFADLICHCLVSGCCRVQSSQASSRSSVGSVHNHQGLKGSTVRLLVASRTPAWSGMKVDRHHGRHVDSRDAAAEEWTSGFHQNEDSQFVTDATTYSYSDGPPCCVLDDDEDVVPARVTSEDCLDKEDQQQLVVRRGASDSSVTSMTSDSTETSVESSSSSEDLDSKRPFSDADIRLANVMRKNAGELAVIYPTYNVSLLTDSAGGSISRLRQSGVRSLPVETKEPGQPHGTHVDNNSVKNDCESQTEPNHNLILVSPSSNVKGDDVSFQRSEAAQPLAEDRDSTNVVGVAPLSPRASPSVDSSDRLNDMKDVPAAVLNHHLDSLPKPFESAMDIYQSDYVQRKSDEEWDARVRIAVESYHGGQLPRPSRSVQDASADDEDGPMTKSESKKRSVRSNQTASNSSSGILSPRFYRNSSDDVLQQASDGPDDEPHVGDEEHFEVVASEYFGFVLQAMFSAALFVIVLAFVITHW